MRTLFVTFFAAGALASVAVGADASKSDLLAPPEVIRLADAFLSALPQQESAAQKNELRAEFARMFLVGFLYATGSVSGERDSATGAGLEAGVQYRRSNPDKFKQTLEGFGYTATNAQGTWTVAFELSEFRADGHFGREWWLTPLSVGAPKEGGRVRISGFLSPKGQHGHLGAYEHEFVATNISPIRVSQPNGAADGSQPSSSETNRASGAASPRR
jgi:hypothetical protein